MSRVVLAVAMGIAASFLVHVQSASADGPLQATGHDATKGRPVPGQYLTADQGSWTDPPTGHEYQWLRDGTPIAGATARDYLVQTADVGHTITPFVTGTRGGEEAWFTGTAKTARRIESTLTVDVRQVQTAPGRPERVWVAGGSLALERPWPTDGGSVMAYRKKANGTLKPLGTATLSRGTAIVRLGWKQPPEGRTRIKLCFAGNEAVAPTCDGAAVRGRA